MNNQGGISTSGTTMMTGVNTMGLIAIIAYSVRNINELQENINELNNQIKTLKTSHVENTKRTHSAIGKLNEKIISSSKGQSPSHRKAPEPKIVEVDDDEINDQIDDVSAAISELMKN